MAWPTRGRRHIVVLAVLLLVGLWQRASFSPFQDERTAPPALADTPASSQYLPTIAVGFSTVGNTYYVSKTGDNSDGRSWATAWNELDQIQWPLILPGDIIVLDGGQDEMVYATPITVGRSGTPEQRITIMLASEPGRSGSAVIFGGRATPLPYCEQTDYDYQPGSQTGSGVDLRGDQWVVIDGTHWRGIQIHGHNRYGINLDSQTSHVTVRNVEVYDNGTAYQLSGKWYPDLPGVNLSGSDNTFANVIVHDNGQDAFQSSGGLHNITIQRAWLYNSRTDPVTGQAFNRCQGPNGVEVFDGGEQRGLLIDQSIIGPGMSEGLLLGAGRESSGSSQPWATLDDVTIRDSLFFGSANANIMSGYDSVVEPRNWRLERVTSYRSEGARWHNLYLEGSDHTIIASIFNGSNLTLANGAAQLDQNCQWHTTGASIGTDADPRFVAPAQTNYALSPDSPCAGKGASITSPTQLLNAPLPPPGPTPTPRPAPSGGPTAPLPTAPLATPSALPQPTLPALTQHAFGVNLAGADFGRRLPGIYDIDYTYPTAAELDYYKSKGMVIVRLPFKWERMQRDLYGDLDADELARMDEFIAAARQRGMYVIPVPHNFGRYYGQTIGGTVSSAAFADLWKRLADHYQNESAIYAYGLMNEPHDMNGFWMTAAQAAINGIRQVDQAHAIMVPGDEWSAASNWVRYNDGLKYLQDRQNNLIFEAHQYFDADQSGQYRGTYDSNNVDLQTGVNRVRPFVEWIQQNHLRGFLGEYGVPDDDGRWLPVLDNFMTYLNDNHIGGTYWAGGPWWGTYPLSIEPRNGQDRPQMSILSKYPYRP